MSNRDTATPIWDDIPAAIGLLTRLPTGGHDTQSGGAAAAWAYPVAGMLVGAIAAMVIVVATWCGLPASLTAALGLLTLILCTGALHEDGLADSADGLWGGYEPARRLAIMKDSHIGAYGVIALVLSLLVRWAALGIIIQHGAVWAALLVTGAGSRAAMVVVMTTLPHARDTGLGHSVGRPDAQTALIGIGIAAVLALFLTGFSVIMLAVSTAIVTLLWAAVARAKIGGQTGDILGASQQLAEITLLLTICAQI